MEKKHSNALYVFIAVVVVVGVAMIGGYWAIRLYESNTVMAVLGQNIQAAKSCLEVRPLGGRTRKIFNTRQYVNELHKIDPSHTPKKFQLAWLDYVQAWEREAEQTNGTMLGEAYIGMLGVVSRSSRLASVAAKPIETANALERAQQNLERVALEYDVRIIHKTDQQS